MYLEISSGYEKRILQSSMLNESGYFELTGDCYRMECSPCM